MDDAIQYLYTLNFSFQFHIGTLTIGTLTFARQCKKSCADGAKTKMETKESDDKHQLVMSNEASKNNHDGRCKSFFCVELSFWRHIHTLTFSFFGQSQWGMKNNTSTHTNKSIVIVLSTPSSFNILVCLSACPH